MSHTCRDATRALGRDHPTRLGAGAVAKRRAMPPTSDALKVPGTRRRKPITHASNLLSAPRLPAMTSAPRWQCPGWESNPHSPEGPEGFKAEEVCSARVGECRNMPPDLGRRRSSVSGRVGEKQPIPPRSLAIREQAARQTSVERRCNRLSHVEVGRRPAGLSPAWGTTRGLATRAEG